LLSKGEKRKTGKKTRYVLPHVVFNLAQLDVFTPQLDLRVLPSRVAEGPISGVLDQVTRLIHPALPHSLDLNRRSYGGLSMKAAAVFSGSFTSSLPTIGQSISRSTTVPIGVNLL
jgi:hypothetical protein